MYGMRLPVYGEAPEGTFVFGVILSRRRRETLEAKDLWLEMTEVHKIRVYEQNSHFMLSNYMLYSRPLS